MKRLFLVVRMIVEAVLGTICVADVFLLPQVWRERDYVGYALGQLLGCIILILIGILCLKDVIRIKRGLKASRTNPSLISKLAHHRFPTRSTSWQDRVRIVRLRPLSNRPQSQSDAPTCAFPPKGLA